MSQSSLQEVPTWSVREAAQAVRELRDYDGLINRASQAQLVLIGEASHGTHEFYVTRAELTRRLIVDEGFRAVVVEADWPDSFRVHRFVTGRSQEASAAEALGEFSRFPTWMWRNRVVCNFVDWLRHWNRGQAPGRGHRAGFYGMDLYSLNGSIEAVLAYLDRADPAAAERARERYACLEHFRTDPQKYGLMAAGGGESCEDEAVRQLTELHRKRSELVARDGAAASEEFFSAEQNARLVMNAERFYRAMFRGRDESWNLRDSHMFETVNRLVEHLGRDTAKLVLWAHNSHLGDARATEMAEHGEHNIGQLIREHYRDRAYLIGFTTYSGTVTAASSWGGPAERKRVRPGLPDSYETLFHEVGIPRFWLDLRAQNDAVRALHQRRLERAIGVIYRPETERWSHYFYACMPEQFDAVIHLDKTRALEPLEFTPRWERGEVPETYPFSV
jgi:erythromycin esterase-like protein